MKVIQGMSFLAIIDKLLHLEVDIGGLVLNWVQYEISHGIRITKICCLDNHCIVFQNLERNSIQIHVWCTKCWNSISVKLVVRLVLRYSHSA
jgi:hypothetical protein